MSGLLPDQELRLACLRLSDIGQGPDIDRARQLEVYITDRDGHARHIAHELQVLTRYIEHRLEQLAKYGSASALNPSPGKGDPAPEAQTGGTDAPPR